MEQIYSYIDEHSQRFIDELATFVKQPSISSQGVGIEDCAALLTRMMEAVGIRYEIMPMGGDTNPPLIYGELMAPAASKTLLIYGHYDVQPPEPLEAWHSPPFEPTIRNGRMFGRGTADNKAQMFAHIKAVEAILKTGNTLPINLKFMFDPEEEIGSPNLDRFIRTTGDKFKADIGYYSDGPVHPSGRPKISFGNRGMCYVEINHQEAGRDVHSGHYAEALPNPNWRMIRFLNSLKDENGRVTIDGFYDDVLPVTEIEKAALAKIPFDEKATLEDLKVSRLNTTEEVGFWEMTTLTPSLNIAGYASGYGGHGAKTIIPCRTKVKIDMRLVKNQNPQDIFQKLKRHMKNHGFDDFEVKLLSCCGPRRTPLDNPDAPAFIRAARKVYEKEPVILPSGGGTVPLAFFDYFLKVPLIAIPYGNPDEMNHAPNENMDLDLFIKGIKASATVFYELAKV
ncbi:MAG: M20/M25/M40 family metallo-hydrolase [Deltaproteobacteria bacterium]|nr:M20/M25/M40 family metallo-hydrolase [Deltaproteobacteria bacterium]MBW2154457.1 M20/M25/M40 family metallo-hydrolase [Deltaproteobacteria bacterium]